MFVLDFCITAVSVIMLGSWAELAGVYHSKSAFFKIKICRAQISSFTAVRSSITKPSLSFARATEQFLRFCLSIWFYSLSRLCALSKLSQYESLVVTMVALIVNACGNENNTKLNFSWIACKGITKTELFKIYAQTYWSGLCWKTGIVKTEQSLIGESWLGSNRVDLGVAVEEWQ